MKSRPSIRSTFLFDKSMQILHVYFPSKTFQTATTDRGKEFSCYKRIRLTLNISMYFVDPSAKNTNGLLCEIFTKNTNFGKVSRSELAQALIWINGRCRNISTGRL